MVKVDDCGDCGSLVNLIFFCDEVKNVEVKILNDFDDCNFFV